MVEAVLHDEQLHSPERATLAAQNQPDHAKLIKLQRKHMMIQSILQRELKTF